MKKVLFVLSRIPWPVDTGMKGVVSGWCSILHNKCETELHIFFANQNEIEADVKDIPTYIKSYQFGGKVSTKRKLINLFSKSIFGKWPLQASIYYDKNNLDKLQTYVNSVSPDVVVYDMIRTSEYGNIDTTAKKIMYLGDMLSDRYYLQLKNKNYENIFGQSNEQGLFAKISKSKFLSKRALKYEYKKVYKAEIITPKKFDKVVFISKKETNELTERSGCKNVYTIPMGVDYNYFSEAVNDYDNHILNYVGNMNYAPNHASVIDICEKLLPNIKSDYLFHFIGPVPQDLVDRYANNNKIVFTGKAKDLRDAVGKSILSVSPVSFGSGVKTKVIEAFAMGKCVVTNSVGAENIDAQSGTHFFVEDDYVKMAEIIDNLLKDKETIKNVGENAKKLALNNYSNEVIEKDIKRIVLGEQE